MDALSHIEQLKAAFEQKRNIENGLAMSKYMKGRFPFFGVKSEERKQLQREWIKSLPPMTSDERWAIIDALWKLKEREFHYVAVDWMNGWNKKLISETDAFRIESLIVHQSWWDSVDSIASNYLGKYIRLYPERGAELINNWRKSDNMWMNRCCLIYQLKYGKETDFELLKDLITQFRSNKEFFIQKAIGWSLRQYSKYDPAAVKEFTEKVGLTGLARKEAMKYV